MQTMTEAQKVKAQEEIDNLNAKLRAVIKENTVECGAAPIKRTYTYRKSTWIRSL